MTVITPGESTTRASGKSTYVSNRPASPLVMTKEPGNVASSFDSMLTSFTWNVVPMVRFPVMKVAYTSIELIRYTFTASTKLSSDDGFTRKASRFCPNKAPSKRNVAFPIGAT